MATTQEIITRALRRIRVVGINATPSASLSAHALTALNAMIAAWVREGLRTEDMVLTGDTTSGSKKVTGLADSDNEPYNSNNLFVGMHVSGTGIAASTRILSIESTDEVKLDTNATASGSDVSLTFTAIPLDDSLEQAITALLAVRLSEDFGKQVGPVLAADANDAKTIMAGYMWNDVDQELDLALLRNPSSRHYGGTGPEDLTG